MIAPGRGWRVDAGLVTFYFVAALPLQVWSLLAGPPPFMNYGDSLWPSLLAYAVGAPYVGYLLWRRNPRARLAAYVFLTFDILRSVPLAHWLPLVLDVAVILYLQTPAMRRLYPTMWSRRKSLLRPLARS
ncbi:MAG: hypothetical protein HY685_02915 [Chloroflexi bacterium]|nr:hypothetical protein [Chloroflexota bacterium]